MTDSSEAGLHLPGNKNMDVTGRKVALCIPDPHFSIPESPRTIAGTRFYFGSNFQVQGNGSFLGIQVNN